RQKVSGRFPAPVRVHPHVKWCIKTKAKTPGRRIKLQRRDSQICEQSDRLILIQCFEDLSNFAKIFMNALKAIAKPFQSLTRQPQRFRVAIKTQNASLA